MVSDYYKLRENPFGVTPDAGYLYLGVTHREALGSILYGVESGCGFIALIARPGLGKTTLLYRAMEQLRDKARTVFLFQTVCTPLDLLRALLTGLGAADIKGNLVEMQLRLRDILAEQYELGKRVVVVIDEAQNLDDQVLELVRMLSNFETAREKLIQIVLCGQPQLAEKIASPDLIQLRQRVSIFAHLKPFSAEDTGLYIDHRLRTAGCGFETQLFTPEALALIVQYSEGIPRNINNLCFNALSLGCALRKKTIDAEIIREVIVDLDLDRFRNTTALAVRPVGRNELATPAFLGAVSEPAMDRGWISKIAVAAVVLLVLGGTLFASLRWTAPGARVQAKPMADSAPIATAANVTAQAAISQNAREQADNVNPVPAAAAADSADVNQVQEAPPTESTVRVTPGKTLLGICVENFGKCDTGLLQQIHKLNPQLSNFDHIETGQSIRLPNAERNVP